MAAWRADIHADKGREQVAGKKGLVTFVEEGEMALCVPRGKETAKAPAGIAGRAFSQLDEVALVELPVEASLQQLAGFPVTPAGQIPALLYRLDGANVISVMVTEDDGFGVVATGQPVFDCRQEMGLLLLSCWRGVDDDEPS